MTNFWQRLITGTIFVVVLVGAIYYGGWALHIVFGIITLLGLQEFYSIFKKSSTSPDHLLGPIMGTLLYFFGVYAIRSPYPEDKIYLIGTALIIFTILGIAELFRKKQTPFENIGIGFLGIIYLVIPFLLVNELSWSEDPEIRNHIWPLMAIFILVWSNDTFAYLIGKQFGKNKMFERISPKKTWEGFVGGMVFAIIAGILIAYFTDQNMVQYALYGVVVGIFGTLGDLVESMLKRSVSVKDSGKILPGHGGILDRFDAVLFTIPIIYYLDQFIFIN